ncbi:MAG: tRNA pseudouridine(38-40) synthase TruA [Planctomycetota bacterium]|nr:MAG: tRNA pseudouridine(38-40) synthase TruA [Planctomycetota bacterium]
MAADHTAQPPRDEAPRRLRLQIEYDGAAFHGWQRQPAVRTVQGELEKVLTRLLREPVHLVAASRTDAGVHARGQVASFETSSDWPVERLEGALWRHCPPDVTVLRVEPAPPGFHARFDARGKWYRYRILEGRAPAALERGRSWHVRSALDVEAMQRAADRIVGTHDFRGFAASSERRPGVRTLHRVRVHRRERIVRIDVEGDGFLYNMVRTIAGSLVEVGRGRRSPDWIEQPLRTRDRRLAGPTAPACGLYLMRVDYEPAATGG